MSHEGTAAAAAAAAVWGVQRRRWESGDWGPGEWWGVPQPPPVLSMAGEGGLQVASLTCATVTNILNDLSLSLPAH